MGATGSKTLGCFRPHTGSKTLKAKAKKPEPVPRHVPRRQILLAGLPESGKTTLLFQLVNTGMNSDAQGQETWFETVDCEAGRYTITEVNVHEDSRARYQNRFWTARIQENRNIAGLIWVLDNSEPASDDVSAKCFDWTLREVFKTVGIIPVLILRNKIDLGADFTDTDVPEEASSSTSNALSSSFERYPDVKYKTFACCAITRDGVESAFQWLEDEILRGSEASTS